MTDTNIGAVELLKKIDDMLIVNSEKDIIEARNLIKQLINALPGQRGEFVSVPRDVVEPIAAQAKYTGTEMADDNFVNDEDMIYVTYGQLRALDRALSASPAATAGDDTATPPPAEAEDVVLLNEAAEYLEGAATAAANRSGPSHDPENKRQWTLAQAVRRAARGQP